MNLNEFLPYFIASCTGAACYILLIYVLNPGYNPSWLYVAVKISVISAVMSLSIMLFKNKMGDKSEGKG